MQIMYQSILYYVSKVLSDRGFQATSLPEAITVEWHHMSSSQDETRLHYLYDSGMPVLHEEAYSGIKEET